MKCTHLGRTIFRVFFLCTLSVLFSSVRAAKKEDQPTDERVLESLPFKQGGGEAAVRLSRRQAKKSVRVIAVFAFLGVAATWLAVDIVSASIGKPSETQGSKPKKSIEELLRENGASQEVCKNKTGCLFWAIEKREKRSLVRALLEAGADGHTQSEEGETALHRAVYLGKKEIVKVLLNVGGVDVNAQNKKDKKNTPLHLAAYWGRKESMHILLHAKGVKVNARNEEGNTPLHMAASAQWKERIAIIQALIAKGADIHAQNKQGDTPLHLAGEWGRVAAFKELLAKGADINKPNYVEGSSLHKAVCWRKKNIVQIALNVQGVKVNAQNEEGDTPLHMAARTESEEGAAIAALLIAKGADVNVQNKKGDTPLKVAEENSQGSKKIPLLLRDKGRSRSNRGYASLDKAPSHFQNRSATTS